MASLFGGVFLPLGDRIGCVISSPEPLGSHCELIGSGELIVYPSSRRPSVRRRRLSVVRLPFSKIFSCETARQIKAKFYVEPPWEVGTKVCINGIHEQDGRHAI